MLRDVVLRGDSCLPKTKRKQKIETPCKRNASKIQTKCKQTTNTIQTEYKQNTNKIQTKCKINATHANYIVSTNSGTIKNKQSLDPLLIQHNPLLNIRVGTMNTNKEKVKSVLPEPSGNSDVRRTREFAGSPNHA